MEKKIVIYDIHYYCCICQDFSHAVKIGPINFWEIKFLFYEDGIVFLFILLGVSIKTIIIFPSKINRFIDKSEKLFTKVSLKSLS